MALSDVVDLLVCPNCRLPMELSTNARVLSCVNQHAYDVAKQGYVNLLAAAPPRNADTSAMVAARDRFLTGGSYSPIAERLLTLAAEQLGGRSCGRVLEVGAGTGYYLNRLLQGLTEARGIALDVSVAAARRAARTAGRLGSVVADGWQRLPVADGVVDVLLNVFAPRNADEFGRVLADGGALITVTPEPQHLSEIRSPLRLLEIQPAKQDQLRSTLAAFAEESTETLSYPVTLAPDSLRDLVAMGPNAFHLSADEIDDLVSSLAATVEVTVAVRLSVWARLE